MLDGIDYYPKKRKQSKRKLWLLLLVLVLSVVLYSLYGQYQQPASTPSSKQIVISEPTVVQEIALEVSDVAPKLGDNKGPTTPRIESLDKVIETYQQQQ